MHRAASFASLRPGRCRDPLAPPARSGFAPALAGRAGADEKMAPIPSVPFGDVDPPLPALRRLLRPLPRRLPLERDRRPSRRTHSVGRDRDSRPAPRGHARHLCRPHPLPVPARQRRSRRPVRHLSAASFAVPRAASGLGRRTAEPAVRSGARSARLAAAIAAGLAGWRAVRCGSRAHQRERRQRQRGRRHALDRSRFGEVDSGRGPGPQQGFAVVGVLLVPLDIAVGQVDVEEALVVVLF